MSSPSYFECVARHTGICLDLIVVSPDNLGLVDDALLDNTAESLQSQRFSGTFSALPAFNILLLCFKTSTFMLG